MKRRRALWGLSGCAGWAVWPHLAHGVPDELKGRVEAWTAGRPVVWGGLQLELPELVDNGNDVPLRVSAPDPRTPAEAVKRMAVWAPRNPQALVLEATFSHQAPRVELTTRIRLASTQRVVAMAERSDGRILGAEAAVLVALAACIEG